MRVIRALSHVAPSSWTLSFPLSPEALIRPPLPGNGLGRLFSQERSLVGVSMPKEKHWSPTLSNCVPHPHLGPWRDGS